MNTKNIFQNIPKTIKDELFEEIFLGKDLKVERIVSKGHTSPKAGWYDQDENEWVIVLQGEAVISFLDSEDVRLKCGDYINISAHTKHKVSYTSDKEETVWLAIHYN